MTSIIGEKNIMRSQFILDKNIITLSIKHNFFARKNDLDSLSLRSLALQDRILGIWIPKHLHLVFTLLLFLLL